MLLLVDPLYFTRYFWFPPPSSMKHSEVPCFYFYHTLCIFINVFFLKHQTINGRNIFQVHFWIRVNFIISLFSSLTCLYMPRDLSVYATWLVCLCHVTCLSKPHDPHDFADVLRFICGHLTPCISNPVSILPTLTRLVCWLSLDPCTSSHLTSLLAITR